MKCWALWRSTPGWTTCDLCCFFPGSTKDKASISRASAPDQSSRWPTWPRIASETTRAWPATSWEWPTPARLSSVSSYEFQPDGSNAQSECRVGNCGVLRPLSSVFFFCSFFCKLSWCTISLKKPRVSVSRPSMFAFKVSSTNRTKKPLDLNVKPEKSQRGQIRENRIIHRVCWIIAHQSVGEK